MAGWLHLFRSLGEALLALLEAEVEALKGEIARSGRRLGWGLLLLALAGVFALLILGLLTLAAVSGLQELAGLAWWQAALWVAAAYLVVALAVGGLGVGQLRRVENPAHTVGRRVKDHLLWWRRALPEDGSAERLEERGGELP